MNTVDIRDIEASQSLYWTIAIPVTVAVLAVAFIYGYKGDEINDWIHDRTHSWNTTIQFPRPATRKPLVPTTDGLWANWAGTDAGVKEVWRSVRHSARRHKRRTGPDGLRRSTFQSDVLP
jgi:hypothetical protein